MFPHALLGVVLAQTTAAPPAAPARRFGLHLGLNATLTFDLSLGRWLYGGVTTQLTGVAFLANPDRNYVVSALVFGGVALPLVEGPSVRLTADVTPMASYFHSAPVNMLNVGLLAGLRMVHASGFTLALKLPLVGYAGAPDAQRGGLLYYYTGAIATVPLLTVGYSF
jgi:hypothetical protein